MGGITSTKELSIRSSRASTTSMVGWSVFFVAAGTQLLAPFIPGVALIIGFMLGEIYWYGLTALYGISIFIQLISLVMYYNVHQGAKKADKAKARKELFTSIANVAAVIIGSLIFISVLFGWFFAP